MASVPLASAVAQAVAGHEVPSSRGASFSALVGPWLDLGAISPRMVVAEASKPGASAVRSSLALRAIEASEFHRHLATKGAFALRPSDAHPAVQVRQYRWRGRQCEYCYLDPAALGIASEQPLAGLEPPSILLVHGFGAFGDQWRGNMEALARAGYKVYAPTLPGFGRSEKLPAPSSQQLWTEFLRDFVLLQVRGRVVVAGNSIGGFIGTSLAGDHPELVSGLVLLNSAGPIDVGFDLEAWRAACDSKKAPPRVAVELFSRALFWYLETSIKSTLKWLYVTDPSRADEWLGSEIFRAACDPGSLEVFQAAFYLSPPRPLNHLINQHFKKPVMVLQGVLDPLNDAKKRALDLGAACPEHVEVRLVQAGHCPHDEQPEKVNEEIISFVRDKIMKTI